MRKKADYVLAVKGNQPSLYDNLRFAFNADYPQKSTSERRYCISSLPMGARRFGHAVRQHWGIENALHWTLDMTSREDDSRMREGHSAQNYAMMRRIALSLVKHDSNSKRSLRRRRRSCGYDNAYLERLLFNADAFFAPPPSS